MWITGKQKKREKRNVHKELFTDTKGFLTEREAQRWIVKYFKSNVSEAVEHSMGVKLFPFQEMVIKTMLQKDYVLGILSRGIGKCSKDINLQTNRGLIDISEIKVGDKVCTKNGMQKVIDKWVEPKAKAYTLKYGKALDSKVHFQHKFYVFDTKSFTYKFIEAQDIDPKIHYMPIKAGLDYWGGESLTEGFSYKRNPMNRSKLCDYEVSEGGLAYLIGLIMGDGHIGKGRSNLIAFTSNDKEPIDYFTDHFREKIPDNSIRKIEKPNGTSEIRIDSHKFHKLLEYIGVSSEDKLQVPAKLSNSSKENVGDFISGLFDTDGTVSLRQNINKNSKTCNIEYYSCSKKLIDQVHCLLLRFGIMSSVSLKLKAGRTTVMGVECNCQDNYRLTISGRKDVRIFSEQVGFRLPRKQKILDDYLTATADSRMGESNCSYIPYFSQYLHQKYGSMQGLLRKASKHLSLERSKLALESGLLDQKDSDTIKEALAHNFYHDKIKSITKDEFETIGITVEKEHNYWGNGIINHNSFSTAIYAGLEAMLTPNCRIAIISKTFRQSRLLFQTLEDISYKIEASLFSECMTGKPVHANDQWTMKFDNGSVIMALPLGDGCQVLDTQVLTKNGFKTFGDYMPHNLDTSIDHQEFTSPNQQVWSNGRFRKTDQQFYNGIRPTKKLITKKGVSTEATLNHKFKVCDGQNVVWKETGKFKVGDNILIDKSVRWHEGDTDLTKDECYAFGSLIGDGCFRKDGSYLLGFATGDPEMVDYMRKGTPFLWKQSDEFHWYGTGGQEVRDKYLAKFDYMDEKLWATKNKHIPAPILNSSKEKMSAFIRGLMDTDGGVQVQTAKGGTAITATFYNTSERLIDDLQYVLLHYGIVANKSTRNRDFDKRVGKVDWATSYELHITGEDVKTFAEEIGFRLKRKQEKLQTAVAAKKRWRSLSDNAVSVDMSILEDISKTRIPKGKRIGDFRGLASLKRKKVITKHQLNLFVQNYEFTDDPRLEPLKALCDPNVYFDTIVDIQDSEAPTADLHVPDGHEYCANGFFSHNSKLRGFRFNCIIIDEMLLMPEKVLNEVIMPFLSTNANVKQRSEAEDIYTEAVGKGIITQEDYDQIKKTHPLFRNNKMIGLSSASYQFEYLYQLYKDYMGKITKGTNDGKDLLKDGSNKLEGTYSIFQMSYDIAPMGLYNESLLEKSKSEMSKAQFAREFGSQFTDESSGYFSVSSIDKCTTPMGAYPCAQLKGDDKSRYLLATDPNASESDTSDFFAMVLFRIEDDGRFTQVHTYGIAGSKYSNHIKYFHYMLKHFNIEMIVMDNAGGIQFLRACQESKIFSDDPIPLELITDVDLSVSEDAAEKAELKKFRNTYNKTRGRIVYLQKFTADWARQSNEDLQFSIDSGQIKWASDISAIDREFQKAQKVDIGIEKLTFTGDENIDFQGNIIEDDYKKFNKKEARIAKQIDFIEHQEFLMTLTRRQIASIEPRVNASGNSVQFVLPKELQNQKGRNRARRDLYTAVLMGNWIVKKFIAMEKLKPDDPEDWMPMMIDN